MEKIVIGKSSGAEYRLDKKIGEGGQGKVFSIKGGKYAFKLLGKKTSKKASVLQRKLSYLNTLAIEDLPISKPIEQIEGNWLGYIMELATDMIPIENLIKPNSEKGFTVWWKDTGGLQKRLQILRNIAETLSKLHSKGLVYGDFSLSNIFVSKEKNYTEIFFIDPDNITHESKVSTAVYTPGYAAPELIQTENHQATSGYDTYTDYYPFAIIAYQLLTLNHPFIGDYVNNGEPKLEEQAYLGKIPWINHSTDKSNRTEAGIPINLTVSSKMLKAFQDTFEIGIKHPRKRTSINKWKEILTNVLDVILECENKSCKQHFFYSKELICPFCNTKQDLIGVAGLYSINKTSKIKLGTRRLLRLFSANKYIIFTENDFFINSSNTSLFKIKLVNKSVFIIGENLKEIDIITKDNLGKEHFYKKMDIRKEQKISLKKEIRLAFGEHKSYERILKITIRK